MCKSARVLTFFSFFYFLVLAKLVRAHNIDPNVGLNPNKSGKRKSLYTQKIKSSRYMVKVPVKIQNLGSPTFSNVGGKKS